MSVDSGLIASWRGDGRELYYVEQTTNRLMAVSISEDADGLKVGAPEAIATVKPAGPRRFYAAMPDGQRFLVHSVLDEAIRAPITLVVNWSSLLDGAP